MSDHDKLFTINQLESEDFHEYIRTRILRLMKDKKIGLSDLRKRANIHEVTLAQFMRKKRNISIKSLLCLINALESFGLDLVWEGK